MAGRETVYMAGVLLHLLRRIALSALSAAWSGSAVGGRQALVSRVHVRIYYSIQYPALWIIFLVSSPNLFVGTVVFDYIQRIEDIKFLIVLAQFSP